MARLPANKWIAVGSCFGASQRILHVVVDADVPCKWRERCGPFKTSAGNFRRRHAFRVFNQTVEIQSPIETSFDSQFDVTPNIGPPPDRASPA